MCSVAAPPGPVRGFDLLQRCVLEAPGCSRDSSKPRSSAVSGPRWMEFGSGYLLVMQRAADQEADGLVQCGG